MRHTDIRVGDRLTLKRDNAYGFGPAIFTVSALTYSQGYLTPYVRVSELAEPFNAFKPSDFAGRA